ncbi:MAG: S-layer homology domain-containing protein [Armatimonadota bacterium]|nr:S-layer homology domain-containing protein [Armatimonadota bacterium]
MISTARYHMLRLLLPALLIAALTPRAGMCQDSHFPDVPQDNPAYSAVKRLADRGICIGFPDATFRGPTVASRYEVAMESSRSVISLTQAINDSSLAPLPGMGRPAPPPLLVALCPPGHYPDVPMDQMDAMAVLMLKDLKVFPGRADGDFHGDSPTLRSEVAVLLYNLMRPYLSGIPAGLVPHYGDIPAGSPLATAVSALSARGVLLREPGMKTFDPEHPMTHYEWAVAVDSALNAVDASLKYAVTERTAPMDLTVHPGEIMVVGPITAIDVRNATFTINVVSVTLPGAEPMFLTAARAKVIRLSLFSDIRRADNTRLKEASTAGAPVVAVGHDLGVGKDLTARVVQLGAPAP